jgi:hypothetical protein
VLAYCVAVSIDAVQFSEKSRAVRTARPGAQARHAPALVGDGRFLPIARIRAADPRRLADAGVGKAELAKFDGLKKSELIGKAQPLLKNWVPKLMRFDQVKK